MTTESPGSHPHADRPNWRPATTLEEYQRNVVEGLEPFSQRRAAKAMGVSLGKIQRMKLLTHVPEELSKILWAARVGSRTMAEVGRALKTGFVE
jgi:hypothetical protein